MVLSTRHPLLEARRVGEGAERAILALDVPVNTAFEALYSYVVVDEPTVHLMPLHFLPPLAEGTVGREALLSLAVAAKLEYARSRWIDEVVDRGSMASPSEMHRLHGALSDLIVARYREALPGPMSAAFFGTLTALYSKHAASVAIDGSRTRSRDVPPNKEEYSAQVRARNGSFRASVDAVLLLARAPKKLVETARESWHAWVLGAQLYDDALDVEEDYESNHPTWTVGRTLDSIPQEDDGDRPPDHDRFYEAALTNGVLTETLEWAESCFEDAANLAANEFPRWAAVQRGCVQQASRLRNDLQELTPRKSQR